MKEEKIILPKETKEWVVVVKCAHCGKQISVTFENGLFVREDTIMVRCYKCGCVSVLV
jgi:DNA-directed RNA polymerase subunit N (RpoN/RPB10)